MGQACQCCEHKNRAEIDKALVGGISKASLSRRFFVSEASLMNHERAHLSRQLLKSTEIMERANASVLLDELDTCMQKAKGILAKAEKDSKPNLQLSALREIRQSIEFLSKLAVSLAELQQKREQAGQNGSIIEMPTITDGMDVRQAESLWRQYLLQLKLGGSGGTVIVLPEKEKITSFTSQAQDTDSVVDQPDNLPPTRRTRRTSYRQLDLDPEEEIADEQPEYEEPIEEMDPEEAEIEAILAWKPSEKFLEERNNRPKVSINQRPA